MVTVDQSSLTLVDSVFTNL